MTPTSQPNTGTSDFGEALTMPKAREFTAKICKTNKRIA
jgi:hypothetical protein